MLENIVILGCGPAAYVCSIYAATAGLTPLLIEEHTDCTLHFTDSHIIPGITQKITNSEYVALIKEQSSRFNTRFMQKNICKIEIDENIVLHFEDIVIRTKVCVIEDVNILNRLKEGCDGVEHLSGVYVCGTAARTERIAIVLAGSGCETAIDAAEYIENMKQ